MIYSSPKKILVIGATGQLGRLCLKVFSGEKYQTLGTGFSRLSSGLTPLDLSQEGEAAAVVSRVRPDIAIICGAMTDVEGCESSREKAFQINSKSPADIAREMKKIPGGKLVFLSTDYVFDGTCGPYDENSLTHPLNVYGESKLKGEKAVLEASESNLVVRTTTVYSFQAGGNNFTMQLLKRLSQKEKMLVAADQWATPTYAQDLALALENLIKVDACGIIHAAGSDFISRLDFAREAARILKLDPSLIQGLPTSQLKQKAKRPLKAGLKTDRLQKAVGYLMRGIKEGLRDFAENLGKSPVK